MPNSKDTMWIQDGAYRSSAIGQFFSKTEAERKAEICANEANNARAHGDRIKAAHDSKQAASYYNESGNQDQRNLQNREAEQDNTIIHDNNTSKCICRIS